MSKSATGVRDPKDTFVTQRAAVAELLDDTRAREKPQIGTTYAVQSTLLLEKHHHNDQVTDLLKHMKREYAKRMEQCKLKETELEQRQKKFMDDLQQYEGWLKENDAKLAKFTKKAQEEAQARDFKVKELQQLLRQLEELKAQRDALATQLAVMKKYQEFLDHVTSSDLDDKFQGVEGVVKRYKTLKKSQKDLQQLVEKNSDEAEAIRTGTSSLIRDGQNEFLLKSAKVTGLQKRLDDMRHHVRETDARVSTDQWNARERQQRLGAIVVAIQNLYRRCQERSAASGRPAALVKETLLTELQMMDSVSLDIEKYMWVIEQLSGRRV
eukprot:TRINITY_DN2952_c0_g1_i2.p1 TRINITY_DN2952_c0_g1~~TRINITY_DN2952_c0_g1_i2.p1  ORF type:complete len:325 (-),score=68.76 TRINITY_DN2952_c0_g1_i2:734-1708(-)